MSAVVEPRVPMAVVGCDFRNAAVLFRERLVTTEQDRQTIFSGLRSVDPHAGLAIIETCNRIEWVVSTTSPQWAAELLSAKMRERWHNAFPDLDEYPQPYVLTESAAARHLLRVVSGLESLAIGEAQIAGQFQRALQRAREEHTSSDILNGLTNAAGRLAKSSYRLGFRSSHHSGIHGMTAAYINELLAGDTQRRVAVAGMGTIGRRIADTLEELYGYRVTRINRTVDTKHTQTWLPLDEMPSELKTADALAVATGALRPALDEHYFADVTNKKLLVIDVGIPRQLTKEAQELPALDYRDLDALVLRFKLQNGDLNAAREVEDEVQRELERYERFCQERNVVVLLEQAQRRRKDYIQTQIPTLVENRFAHLDPRTRRELESTMKQLISDYSAESFDSIHSVLQELGETS